MFHYPPTDTITNASIIALGDQFFFADRVSTLGIGSAVRNETVETLSEAIIKAVTDVKQIQRAKVAGEQIRKEDGVANAIECIYRDLEYAKSLIPEKSNLTQFDSTATEDGDDDAEVLEKSDEWQHITSSGHGKDSKKSKGDNKEENEKNWDDDSVDSSGKGSGSAKGDEHEGKEGVAGLTEKLTGLFSGGKGH